MTTSTMHTAPPPARIEANLIRGRQALALAAAAAPLAGDGAFAVTRISIHCTSAQALEDIAAEWHVRPHWNPKGSQYVALARREDAEVEAVFCGQRESEPEAGATEVEVEAGATEADAAETAAAA